MGSKISILNDPNNNFCSSIVFYQLARRLKGISLDMLKDYAKRMEVDQGLRDIIVDALDKLIPRIRTLYDGIQAGTVKVRQLPKSGVNSDGIFVDGDEKTAIMFRQPLTEPFDEYGEYGHTLYGCLSLFDRVLFAIQFGIWLNNIIPTENIFELGIHVGDVERLWNRYMGFLVNNGVQDVPFISYMAFTPDRKEFERNGHVLIGVYDVDGVYNYIDSNHKDKIKSDELVVLWANEYNADTLHAFVTI